MSEASNPAENAEVVTPNEEVPPVETEEVSESQEVATPEDPSPVEEPESEEDLSALDAEKVETDKRKAWYATRKAKKELRETRQQIEAEQVKLARTEETAPATRPKAEDFEFDDERHREADINFLVDQRVAKVETERREQEAVATSQREIQNFNSKGAEYGQENEEYLELVKEAEESEVKIHPYAAQAILESDLGPQVHHAILRDPVLIDKIGAMTPTQAIKEIGRLEATVMQKQNVPKKKTTQTPAPIDSPVGGGRGGNSGPLDPDDPKISMKEFDRRMDAKWEREHPR